MALLHTGSCSYQCRGVSAVGEKHFKPREEEKAEWSGVSGSCFEMFRGGKGSHLSYETQHHHWKKTVLGGLTKGLGS